MNYDEARYACLELACKYAEPLSPPSMVVQLAEMYFDWLKNNKVPEPA